MLLYLPRASVSMRSPDASVWMLLPPGQLTSSLPSGSRCHICIGYYRNFVLQTRLKFNVITCASHPSRKRTTREPSARVPVPARIREGPQRHTHCTASRHEWHYYHIANVLLHQHLSALGSRLRIRPRTIRVDALLHQQSRPQEQGSLWVSGLHPT